MSLYDKIAASAPINRQAAVSTGRGTEWTPIVKLLDWLEAPLSMKPVLAEHRASVSFVDYTGLAVGRLRVLGMVDRDDALSEKQPARWLCRCVCGAYCTRRAKSLRVAAAGGNSFVSMCGRCHYQGKLATGWAPEKKARP